MVDQNVPARVFSMVEAGVDVQWEVATVDFYASDYATPAARRQAIVDHVTGLYSAAWAGDQGSAAYASNIAAGQALIAGYQLGVDLVVQVPYERIIVMH